jgi:DNA-binding MarR family transcriptional regulator
MRSVTHDTNFRNRSSRFYCRFYGPDVLNCTTTGGPPASEKPKYQVFRLPTPSTSQLSNMAKKKKSSSKAKPTPSSRQADPAARWTFLTNHAHVLAVLHADPDLVLRQVALDVGITERAVQRIIQDLEDGGFIRRERVGRKNRYQILSNESLRHPIESHRKIGDLLKLISKG